MVVVLRRVYGVAGTAPKYCSLLGTSKATSCVRVVVYALGVQGKAAGAHAVNALVELRVEWSGGAHWQEMPRAPVCVQWTVCPHKERQMR